MRQSAEECKRNAIKNKNCHIVATCVVTLSRRVWKRGVGSVGLLSRNICHLVTTRIVLLAAEGLIVSPMASNATLTRKTAASRAL